MKSFPGVAIARAVSAVSAIFLFIAAPKPDTNAQTFSEGASAGDERKPTDLVFKTREAGPHHRELVATNETGEVVSRYVELASGLNRWNESLTQWVPAEIDVEIFDHAAVVRKASWEGIFSAGADSPAGVFDILMPAEPGKKERARFRGQCVGIAMVNRRTGQAIWIAEPVNVGGLAGSDEVIYPGALLGDRGFSASILYKLRLSGVSQDIVVHTATPSVEEAGFPEGTDASEIFVEVWSEILEGAEPQIDHQVRTLDSGQEVMDSTVVFDSMTMGRGRAFALDGQTKHPLGFGRGSIPVTKEYAVVQGMRFIIEAVPFTSLSEKTANLKPLAAYQKSRSKSQVASSAGGKIGPLTMDRFAYFAREKAGGIQSLAGVRTLPTRHDSAERQVPKARAGVKMRKQGEERKLAMAGYVLDWDLSAGSLTNYTFLSDTTYYVNGMVTLYETNILEGGTVLKMATNGLIALAYRTNAVLVCRTGPYNPAVFCARDDQSLGAWISGSTGIPKEYPCALAISDSCPSINMSYVKVRDAQTGFAFDFIQTTNNVVSHSQFLRCETGMTFDTSSQLRGKISLRNVLFADCSYAAFQAPFSTEISCEHVTVSKSEYLLDDWDFTNQYLKATNCLFSNVTNSYSMAGQNNLTNSGGSTFSEVGGGKHYTNYRDNGTTNINATLAVELKQLTTYPPTQIGSDITTNTVLAPVVQRDIDVPDIGYHLPVLDYLCGERNVTNAVLVLTNGVAVGFYGTNGVVVRTGAEFHSQGLAERLNQMVHYSTVQEGSASGWDPITPFRSFVSVSASLPRKVNLRFTAGKFLADDASKRSVVWTSTGNAISNYVVRDCQFVNTYHQHQVGNTNAGISIDMVNNQFWRAHINYLQWAVFGFYNFPLNFQNNVVRKGTGQFLYNSTGSTWTITDNLFDTVSISTASGGGGFLPSHNGYFSTTSLGGSNNKTLTTLDFQTGPLGAHYYPTNGGNLSTLIDAGSRNATNAGLFHYTTLVSTNKEGNSVVDLGFHYVAGNANGIPTDTDADGIPDYLEDRNGNGVFDPGETDWLTSNQQYWPDTNGVINLRVFTPLQ